MSTVFKSLLLHLSAFLWCCFGTYHDQYTYYSPNFTTYGGRFKYLTHCTAYLCLATYGFAFLVDLIYLLTSSNTSDRNKDRSFLVSVRDYLITMWSSNLSVFVAIMFWAVACIDLEGIHPAEHQKIVPLFGWFNHYLHTVPALISFFLLINVNYQHRSFFASVVSAIVFGVSYFSWMKHISDVMGSWPYNFIDGMSTNAFAGFVVVTHVVILVIDLFNRWISRLAWGADDDNVKLPGMIHGKANKKRV